MSESAIRSSKFKVFGLYMKNVKKRLAKPYRSKRGAPPDPTGRNAEVLPARPRGPLGPIFEIGKNETASRWPSAAHQRVSRSLAGGHDGLCVSIKRRSRLEPTSLHVTTSIPTLIDCGTILIPKSMYSA
jgi:hypothetical protein